MSIIIMVNGVACIIVKAVEKETMMMKCSKNERVQSEGIESVCSKIKKTSLSIDKFIFSHTHTHTRTYKCTHRAMHQQ